MTTLKNVAVSYNDIFVMFFFNLHPSKCHENTSVFLNAKSELKLMFLNFPEATVLSFSEGCSFFTAVGNQCLVKENSEKVLKNIHLNGQHSKPVKPFFPVMWGAVVFALLLRVLSLLR